MISRQPGPWPASPPPRPDPFLISPVPHSGHAVRQPTLLGQLLLIFQNQLQRHLLWTPPSGHFHWIPIVFLCFHFIFKQPFLLKKKNEKCKYAHDKTSESRGEHTVQRESPSPLHPATPLPSQGRPLSPLPPRPLPTALSTRPCIWLPWKAESSLGQR